MTARSTTPLLAAAAAVMALGGMATVVVRSLPHVPERVVVVHEISGRADVHVVVDVKGLEKLRAVPDRIRVDAPQTFTLQLPTGYAGKLDVAVPQDYSVTQRP
ncbi:MAG: hypothetical protein LC640_09385 [Frankia sp.]|nr:hypothetical protein [Frankia sp.]